MKTFAVKNFQNTESQKFSKGLENKLYFLSFLLVKYPDSYKFVGLSNERRHP
jgi:hypothetical protein